MVRHEIFLFSESSRLAHGPTHPLIQWVLGNLSLALKELGRKLITHFHPVSSLRLGGTVPPLPLKL